MKLKNITKNMSQSQLITCFEKGGVLLEIEMYCIVLCLHVECDCIDHWAHCVNETTENFDTEQFVRDQK